jgi:hypothetical protein
MRGQRVVQGGVLEGHAALLNKARDHARLDAEDEAEGRVADLKTRSQGGDIDY